jgi:long-chain acyl-CoA synthetase
MNDLLAFSPTVLYAVPDLLERLLSVSLPQEGLAKVDLSQADLSKADLSEASPPMGLVQRLPGLRTLILGGGAWMPHMTEQINAFSPQAKTWLFYGTAEASFIGYSSPADWPWYRPFPGVEVQVSVETGQLSVRSPFACLAPKGGDLWESPGESETAEVWAHGDMAQHEQDPWLGISDCVEMDATQGDIRFRLVGRMERIIRLNGVDIAPEPIEDFLAMHYSGSLFCVCLNDHVGPARLGLFYCSDVELTDTARIRGLVKEAFPCLPVLSVIQRLDTWPRLASGKTDFQRLGDLARGLR